MNATRAQRATEVTGGVVFGLGCAAVFVGGLMALAWGVLVLFGSHLGWLRTASTYLALAGGVSALAATPVLLWMLWRDDRSRRRQYCGSYRHPNSSHNSR